VHELVGLIDTAERARPDRDCRLRIGCGGDDLVQRVVKRAHRRSGDQQQVGVTGRWCEEEPEAMQVVVGRGEQADLRFADRA
jgi:hypothetical protein